METTDQVRCIVTVWGLFYLESLSKLAKTLLNTLRLRQNLPPFRRRHFQRHFLEWKFRNNADDFIEVWIYNIPALVLIMAWRRPGDKPLPETMMISLLTHICVTRPQWVNALWPSDAMRWNRSGSTLAQVMACCMMAPSHYLNQCSLINQMCSVAFTWEQFHTKSSWT